LRRSFARGNEGDERRRQWDCLWVPFISPLNSLAFHLWFARVPIRVRFTPQSHFLFRLKTFNTNIFELSHHRGSNTKVIWAEVPTFRPTQFNQWESGNRCWGWQSSGLDKWRRVWIWWSNNYLKLARCRKSKETATSQTTPKATKY